MVYDAKERPAKAPLVWHDQEHDVSQALAKPLVVGDALGNLVVGHELALGVHPCAPGPQLFQTHMTTTKPPTSTRPVVMTLETFTFARPCEWRGS
jgi:hypothetical protein